MQNIRDFNVGVALIMAKLYENFPTPIQIQANELHAPGIKEGDSDIDEKAKQWCEVTQVYYYSALFLLDEGYIRGDLIEGYLILNNCRLTSKGLAALEQTPKSLKANKSIGEWFLGIANHSVKNLSVDGIKLAVRALLTVS
ncbi:TPA: hypothetical protein NKP51_005131 [Vibrio parahaemolyticus]|nr:hypothetical protein [Vibrio parahaemolyticus]HCH1023809.1 hypothetical protein [Vibrio parahaemolyticus]